MAILAERRTYVAGQWVTGDEVVRVENPADETHVADITATPLDQVEHAIGEARRSFDAGRWADLAVADRARILHAFIDHIEAAADVLVPTLVAEAGQPTRFAEMTQLRAGVGLARQTIDLYQSMTHEEASPVPVDDLVRGRVALSIRRHEPVGVVAAITPYNAALIMGFQKLIPALMAGNSVILRPSPLTPMSSLIFGMAADAAGLPSGVLSVVVESGTAAAELLTSHPAVDMVSFTGSTLAGRKILAQAAPTVKRVSLELGGKSAQIYLADAIHRVAAGAAMVVMSTAGQACVAATRMLVPEDLRAQAVEAVSGAYRAITVGPPDRSDAAMGPVISAAQRDKCERIIAAAEENGAKVVCGGARPEGLSRGYYLEPTVLDVADNANPAAQEEIFGPVIAVLGYRDLDHAVSIANDSIYGLSGQVYGADVATAVQVARRLRTGAVNVNTTVFSAYAPSGGYKQSGLGRERGPDGIREFQEVKHMSIGELSR
ncbi:aldehyde dehydrogenase family protein [Mycolicibacterium pulveris]|uniref:Aldehyde dehydrogenase n=1 Tax=Mycolicibacterium pulveris TaxID=36813 RepID=A0A7I7UIE7_MYCPV|nr:aldehyde dehydrogenase family protein [Mycolicibacterium pulveris]MCV6980944.1 aldehyde dehydrogenase family protein [Mycolicibacterium pulveris]BBY80469.1 aldehyde dehydrogenase [Mycolicibacterium pulveris]